MKPLNLIFVCVCSFGNMYAQNAAGVYKRAVNSTVTIVTDNRQIGSGFFVEDNIVATNFHVMEGASAAYCYLNNYTVRYEITGYLAVDTEADLVLPEVSGVKKPAISQWIETSSLTLT